MRIWNSGKNAFQMSDLVPPWFVRVCMGAISCRKRTTNIWPKYETKRQTQLSGFCIWLSEQRLHSMAMTEDIYWYIPIINATLNTLQLCFIFVLHILPHEWSLINISLFAGQLLLFGHFETAVHVCSPKWNVITHNCNRIRSNNTFSMSISVCFNFRALHTLCGVFLIC